MEGVEGEQDAKGGKSDADRTTVISRHATEFRLVISRLTGQLLRMFM